MPFPDAIFSGTCVPDVRWKLSYAHNYNIFRTRVLLQDFTLNNIIVETYFHGAISTPVCLDEAYFSLSNRNVRLYWDAMTVFYWVNSCCPNIVIGRGALRMQV